LAKLLRAILWHAQVTHGGRQLHLGWHASLYEFMDRLAHNQASDLVFFRGVELGYLRGKGHKRSSAWATLRSCGRYPALLVCLHGWLVHRRRDAFIILAAYSALYLAWAVIPRRLEFSFYYLPAA